MTTAQRTMILLLLALSAVAPAAILQAQAKPDSVRLELTMRLLRVTRVSASAIEAIEAGIPAQRAAMPQLPPEFWDRFLVRAKASVDSLAMLIAPLYVETFTEDELRGLLAFYDTPLGRRMVEAQPKLIMRSAQIGQQWGAAIGAELARELLKPGSLDGSVPTDPRRRTAGFKVSRGQSH